MKQQWDDRYSTADYIYGTEPNAFFAEQLSKFPLGRILFPAEGEGRNAVYAASQGWTTDAFDQSTEGMLKAIRLAGSKNVEINYQLLQLEEWNPLPEQYDCIAFIFVHLPPELRKQVHARAVKALQRGGIILLEAFTQKQLPLGSGGPKIPELLYTAADISSDFRELEIVNLTETQTQLLEGRLHNGPAEVVRLVARKS